MLNINQGIDILRYISIIPKLLFSTWFFSLLNSKAKHTHTHTRTINTSKMILPNILLFSDTIIFQRYFPTLQNIELSHHVGGKFCCHYGMAVSEINLWYNEEDPVLFFVQIKSGCELKGITSQRRKFHLAVSNLTRKAAQEVREIISPPAVNPYDTLRDKLIARTSISQGKNPSQLFIGDSKFSQFLHHL